MASNHTWQWILQSYAIKLDAQSPLKTLHLAYGQDAQYLNMEIVKLLKKSTSMREPDHEMKLGIVGRGNCKPVTNLNPSTNTSQSTTSNERHQVSFWCIPFEDVTKWDSESPGPIYRSNGLTVLQYAWLGRTRHWDQWGSHWTTRAMRSLYQAQYRYWSSQEMTLSATWPIGECIVGRGNCRPVINQYHSSLEISNLCFKRCQQISWLSSKHSHK